MDTYTLQERTRLAPLQPLRVKYCRDMLNDSEHLSILDLLEHMPLIVKVKLTRCKSNNKNRLV
jgi:hypothetical protein